MPVMDGFESVSLMRENGVKIPIVALTANAMKGFDKKVYSAGFSHYMVKPINIDTLGGLLAEQFGQTEPASGSFISSDKIPSPAAEHKREASTWLVSELALSDQRFIPIVEDFSTKLEQRIVELREALQDKQWNMLADVAHWLKGAAGNVGLHSLVDPARDLEKAAKNNDQEACSYSVDLIADMQSRILADPSNLTDEPSSYSVENCDDIADDSCDESAVESTLPIDVPEFHEVVGLFLERLEEKMQRLRVAVDNVDVDVISEVLHWLRGSGGSVGFPGYSDRCDQIKQSVEDITAGVADSAEQPSKALEDALASLEKFNRRILAGWDSTPPTGPDSNQLQ